MPITHGVEVRVQPINITPVGVSLPIAVVGLASSGTAQNNKLALVKSQGDALTLFGQHSGTDTIPRSLEILQRYGCTCLIGLKIPVGGTSAQTETNILGGINATTGDKEGLEALRDCQSQLNVTPAIILVPGFNSAAIITKALAIASDIGAICLFNFTVGETVATVTTARGGNTGLGTKHQRLGVCFPHLKNSVNNTVLEPLSTHWAGLIAKTDAEKSFGWSADNQQLVGVSAPELNMSFSTSDESADTEKLFDLGVLTINSDEESGKLVTWGTRSANFPAVTDASSYLNIVRVRDRIGRLSRLRANKFLGYTSNAPSALLLETSLNNLLDDLRSGNYPAITDGRAKWIQEQSDLSAGKWVHQVQFTPLYPTEFISVSIELVSQVS
jgi:uncharacterized protein